MRGGEFVTKKTLPIKTVYYESEEDEFAVDDIKTRRIGEDYKYLRQGASYSLLRFMLYRMIATPLGWGYCKLKLGHRVKCSKLPDSGFMLFGNHTQQTADAFIPSLAVFPRDVYVVVHPNNVSMPVLGRITPYLGAIPTPDSIRSAMRFREAVRTRLAEGRCVCVYPEAHIWPYYTGIRYFSDSSVRLAVEFGAPAYTMTTVYKKRRRFSSPRAITYIDGPFLPKEGLPLREAAAELRDRLYEKMLERARESDCEYIRYLKKEDVNYDKSTIRR